MQVVNKNERWGDRAEKLKTKMTTLLGFTFEFSLFRYVIIDMILVVTCELMVMITRIKMNMKDTKHISDYKNDRTTSLTKYALGFIWQENI